MSNLPQQDTAFQYYGNGSQTVFTYGCLLLDQADIAVYVTPPGQTANPIVDRKTLTTDYTIQGVGNPGGGTVTFVTAPESGAIITLVREMQASINTAFADARNFNGATLDAAFQRTMMVIQQNTYDILNRSLSYFINSDLPVPLQDTQMPILGDQQIWQKVNGVISAVTLTEGEDVSTLRSQLASQTEGAPGTSIVGAWDETNSEGKTSQQLFSLLQSQIATLETQLSQLSTALLPLSSVGTVIFTFTDANQWTGSGWLRMIDGTIGSASSLATVRANADTEDLFIYLWEEFDNTECPVSGGRGLNAAADFTANKNIALPLNNGRTFVNNGTAYANGESFGANTVSLTGAQNGLHEHESSNGDNFVTVIGVGGYGLSGGGFTDSGSNVTASSGTGEPHENRQPSVAGSWYIRYLPL